MRQKQFAMDYAGINEGNITSSEAYRQKKAPLCAEPYAMRYV